MCLLEDACKPKRVVTVFVCVSVELNPAFFPGAPDVWPPHPLAYTAELPGAAAAAAAGLQHHPALFPALHAQVPVRSYLWLTPDKQHQQHHPPAEGGPPLPHTNVHVSPYSYGQTVSQSVSQLAVFVSSPPPPTHPPTWHCYSPLCQAAAVVAAAVAANYAPLPPPPQSLPLPQPPNLSHLLATSTCLTFPSPNCPPAH